MILTITGSVELEDIKQIVRDNLDHLTELEIYIPYGSFYAIVGSEEVRAGLVFMNSHDLDNGRITLYGASVRAYFPEILSEEES